MIKKWGFEIKRVIITTAMANFVIAIFIIILQNRFVPDVYEAVLFFYAILLWFFLCF